VTVEGVLDRSAKSTEETPEISRGSVQKRAASRAGFRYSTFEVVMCIHQCTGTRIPAVGVKRLRCRSVPLRVPPVVNRDSGSSWTAACNRNHSPCQTSAKHALSFVRGFSIHEITRIHLLEVIGRIETRKSLSVGQKARTWLRQLPHYAIVVIPGIEMNTRFKAQRV
jgi:hypothetical protein